MGKTFARPIVTAEALKVVTDQQLSTGPSRPASPAPADEIQAFNLRLARSVFGRIDALCRQRPGRLSRNTWIAEAVAEKLAREDVTKE